MKILYINALYAPYIAGGAEISLKLIVEGIQARGHEVAVLSLVPEGGVHHESVDGVKVYRVGLRNRYWPFSTERPGRIQRLRWHLRDRYNKAMGAVIGEVLRREQPDVVSCHNLVGWSIAAWDEITRAGIPIVQVLHDMYLLSPDSTLFKDGRSLDRPDLLARVFRRRHKQLSAGLAAVVAISHSILERFVAQGYFSRVPRYVVHNVREVADPGAPKTRRDRQPLTVGYIGTVSEAKGVAWLIQAFKASGIDGQLHIAGSGKAGDIQYMKDRAEGDGRIRFLGHVDPVGFYPNIDVLVVPSLWEEPLGMVAIEGLANHLPVIASDRGGLRESVIEGHNGIRCDPDHPGSLQEALYRIWSDAALYNRMAGVARSSVSGYLSVDRMVNEYEHILHTVISTHAAP